MYGAAAECAVEGRSSNLCGGHGGSSSRLVMVPIQSPEAWSPWEHRAINHLEEFKVAAKLREAQEESVFRGSVCFKHSSHEMDWTWSHCGSVLTPSSPSVKHTYSLHTVCSG